ncbi:MAG TPA: MazG-like family protein, partial [Pseudolabrys sp.]|nr:MazG-like family protein [Pseudolabrys sp.]
MVEISHTNLRAANIARQQEWDAGNQITLAYRGNELAGEVGEACNAIKKLERERMGIAGSRDTIEHLAEELADVVICADLIAMQAGVDLDAAVEAKFNATSEEVGLATRYRRAEARQAPRLTRDLVSLVIAAREFWDVHNDLSEESIALDKALDRFSEQIPYENGPSAPLPAETVTEAWSYTINYGPDGEENYAYVYTPDGEFVGNLKIHHARAIVGGLNEAALAARPCNSRQDGDASDAEMGAACRKFNIGTPARLDAIMARLRAAEAARPAEPVAVKGLRWEQPDGHGETHSWLGHGTDYCQYYIRWDSNGAWVIPGDADEPDA